MKGKIDRMSKEEQKKYEVYAVSSGCKVEYSSSYFGVCSNYRLGNTHPICPAWNPMKDEVG